MAYIGTSPSNGVRRRFVYEATASQTSFSGSDENGVTLTYVDSLYLDVFQNGIKLKAGDDYTATTGTTVVLVQGASANDVVEMVAFDIFSVGDTVSAKDGGGFGGNISTSGTLTVTGNADLNGDLDVDGTTNLDVVDIDGAVDMASTLNVAGLVGIGTSSPSFENGTGLEIRYAGGLGAHLKLTDSASGAGGSNGFDLYAFNTSGYIENYEAGSIIFRNNGAERMRIIGTGFTKHSDNGTYRDAAGNFHEFTVSTTGGALVGAFANASYADGGIQSIAVRAATGDTYRFFEGYSNNAADREFRVDSDGAVHADGAYSSSGGDYAEMFEWKDGNSSSEDRVGKTVVLDGNQIKLSTSNDAQATIIGVVSATPVVLGDAQDEKWIGKYETDSYGRYVFEEYTQTEWTVETDKGAKETKSYQTDMIPSDVTVPDDAIVTSEDENGVKLMRRKRNSSYDETQTYTPRVERKEFSAIGLVGKLRVTVGQTVGDRWIKMREISDTVHEYLVR
jgi:hypothetical protein